MNQSSSTTFFLPSQQYLFKSSNDYRGIDNGLIDVPLLPLIDHHKTPIMVTATNNQANGNSNGNDSDSVTINPDFVFSTNMIMAGGANLLKHYMMGGLPLFNHHNFPASTLANLKIKETFGYITSALHDLSDVLNGTYTSDKQGLYYAFQRHPTNHQQEGGSSNTSLVNLFDTLKSATSFLGQNFKLQMKDSGASAEILGSIDQIQKGVNLSLQILQHQYANGLLSNGVNNNNNRNNITVDVNSSGLTDNVLVNAYPVAATPVATAPVVSAPVAPVAAAVPVTTAGLTTPVAATAPVAPVVAAPVAAVAPAPVGLAAPVVATAPTGLVAPVATAGLPAPVAAVAPVAATAPVAAAIPAFNPMLGNPLTYTTDPIIRNNGFSMGGYSGIVSNNNEYYRYR